MRCVVRCCFTDPLEWSAGDGGTITFDDEGCDGATESSTWAGVKSLHR